MLVAKYDIYGVSKFHRGRIYLTEYPVMRDVEVIVLGTSVAEEIRGYGV